MQLEDYFVFLAPNDIRIKGTRVGIETVLSPYLRHGKTPDEIVKMYPTLTLEQVHATFRYYEQNREAIDKYIEDWREWGRRMREEQARNPHPGVVRLKQLLAEREAARRATS